MVILTLLSKIRYIYINVVGSAPELLDFFEKLLNFFSKIYNADIYIGRAPPRQNLGRNRNCVSEKY